MKRLFLPIELSLLAKEKGFDEPCFGLYLKQGNFKLADYVGQEFVFNNDTIDEACTAPLYQQIIDWFEEKHNIIILLHFMMGTNEWTYWIKKADGTIISSDIMISEAYGSKYKALDKGIEKAFKLI